MNPLLFLLAGGGVGLAVAVPPRGGGGGGNRKGAGGHHKGAGGHDQNCVDISRYSEIFYNTSEAEFCTYKLDKQCQPQSKRLCAPVSLTTCQLTAKPDCTRTSLGLKTVRNDQIEQQLFTPKDCSQTGTQTILQPAQRPVCVTVTRPQHCESKWVVNDLGEKVWDGNENCESVTTEECSLEDYTIPIQVPVYGCTDGVPLTYSVPVVATETVTAYAHRCQAAVTPVCKTTTSEECIDVAYEDCEDVIVPQCQGGEGGEGQLTPRPFQIPYQTFDHRLKCLV